MADARGEGRRDGSHAIGASPGSRKTARIVTAGVASRVCATLSAVSETYVFLTEGQGLESVWHIGGYMMRTTLCGMPIPDTRFHSMSLPPGEPVCTACSEARANREVKGVTVSVPVDPSRLRRID
jgi:hypothetical protein